MSNAAAHTVGATKLVLERTDCLVGMAKLPPESVDLVVTSPPYNLGIKYNSYKDQRDLPEYLEWTRKWVTAVKRVLKENGSFFLNLGSAPSKPILPYEVLFAIKDILVLQNTIHWIKSISLQTRPGSEISAGHFKPIQGKRFLNDCHEFLFHFSKSGNAQLDRISIGVPYVHKSNISRWSHTQGKDRRCRGNTWFVPYETITRRSKDRPHPATFPVELAENCIKLHQCGSASVVLDPFLGIGSSGCAATKCGVGAFIGFEIDAEYLKIAQERIQGRSAQSKSNAKSENGTPDLFGAPE